MIIIQIILSTLILLLVFGIFSSKKSLLRRIAKYLMILLISVLIGGFLLFKWNQSWSPQARKAELNVKNSMKLKTGMSPEELIRIMGEPYSIKLSGQDSIYYYQPPFAASSGIDIVVTGDTIKKINYFE